MHLLGRGRSRQRCKEHAKHAYVGPQSAGVGREGDMRKRQRTCTASTLTPSGISGGKEEDQTVFHSSPSDVRCMYSCPQDDSGDEETPVRVACRSSSNRSQPLRRTPTPRVSFFPITRPPASFLDFSQGKRRSIPCLTRKYFVSLFRLRKANRIWSSPG